jgi:hypothetical protein
MGETLTEADLPKHKCALYITHNEHLSVYETVAQELEHFEGQWLADDWAAEGEREKAIETNELWKLQWYPSSPVGFSIILASSFDVLVKWMKDNQP